MYCNSFFWHLNNVESITVNREYVLFGRFFFPMSLLTINTLRKIMCWIYLVSKYQAFAEEVCLNSQDYTTHNAPTEPATRKWAGDVDILLSTNLEIAFHQISGHRQLNSWLHSSSVSPRWSGASGASETPIFRTVAKLSNMYRHLTKTRQNNLNRGTLTAYR